MKIEFTNMAKGQNKFEFILRYIFNIIRTWYYFHFKYPWVKYSGFVRIMKGTSFAKREIIIGDKVQFGIDVLVACDAVFNNEILIAGKVSFVGRNDHVFNIPEQTIWDSPRGVDEPIVVEDDVWIGNNSTIISGIKIGKGSIIAAGSVVTKSIPPCEVWGGIPACKIKNRFHNIIDFEKHIKYLDQKYKRN